MPRGLNLTRKDLNVKYPLQSSLLVLLITGLILIVNSCKKEELPTLSTSTVTNITATSASSGGIITSDGGSAVTARGTCWSLNANPTTSDSKTSDGIGVGQFVSNLNGLTAGSTYHVRAYATNSIGTAYGAEMSFITLGQEPEGLTQPATNISPNSATLIGTVNANYLSTTVTFEYGTTTSYGQTVTASQSPVAGSSMTNVSADVTDLAPGTTYHFRIKTVNSLGTTFGNDLIFTTLGQAPTAITNAACCITSTGAVLSGTVSANYLSTMVSFEYGTTAAYGNSITASQSPITGNYSVSVSASVSELNSGTTYYFRVKAENSLGTTYGDDMSFTTIMADVDGNVYTTVTIGTQVWMKENLKTSKYRNGDQILTGLSDIDWVNTSSGAYSIYDNNDLNNSIYGKLYNWFAVSDSRQLCPTGWHVPTDAEWHQLILFIDPNAIVGEEESQIGGDQLKETGTAHWNSPNTGATDEYDFTALPGGYRGQSGMFYSIRYTGYWWSTLENFDLSVCGRQINEANGYFNRFFYPKYSGYSIRCIKD